MQSRPVTGLPSVSPVMLIGQAPGVKEAQVHRPFAWTAGKTLFQWFDRIGLGEEQFRRYVYMAAVCRCFPGKLPKGGDRVPSESEVENCAYWMQREFTLLEPRLVIPVGKLAISQFMEFKRLNEVIGRRHRVKKFDHQVDIVPLPHPSGASTWHRTQPGIGLLEKALATIRRHAAWRAVLDAARDQ
jgi:uracil-DNA glycosylase